MRTIDIERCDAGCPWFHSNRHHQALCLFSGRVFNLGDVAKIQADAVPFPVWCRLQAERVADKGALDFTTALRISKTVIGEKAFKLLDGTPESNDLAVRMASRMVEMVSNVAALPVADNNAKPKLSLDDLTDQVRGSIGGWVHSNPGQIVRETARIIQERQLSA